MIEGKLKNGFKYTLEDEVVQDWELLRALRKVDKGETALIVDVAETLLGEAQLDKLVNYMKKEGRVTIERMVEAITEIMEENGETKN